MDGRMGVVGSMLGLTVCLDPRVAGVAPTAARSPSDVWLLGMLPAQRRPLRSLVCRTGAPLKPTSSEADLIQPYSSQVELAAELAELRQRSRGTEAWQC